MVMPFTHGHKYEQASRQMYIYTYIYKLHSDGYKLNDSN